MSVSLRHYDCAAALHPRSWSAHAGSLLTALRAVTCLPADAVLTGHTTCKCSEQPIRTLKRVLLDQLHWPAGMARILHKEYLSSLREVGTFAW